MKLKQRFKFIGLPSLALVIATSNAMAGTETMAAPAPSPMSTPDWLKVSGYAAASYTYSDFEGGGDAESSFDAGTPFDAVKLGVEATHGAFAVYGSLFYSPNSDANSFAGGTEAGILDAYASYTVGDFKVTAGKYLSWMGFEAFDAVNMYQMSYANAALYIPAYHTGIKVDYSTDIWGAGFNVSDSVRGPSFWEGDGEWDNGLGYEAYVTYKGIDKVTLWAGASYDDTDGLGDFLSLDFWASYDITDKLMVAGEVVFADDTLAGSDSAVGGLAFLKYAFTEQFSTVLRFGIDEVSEGGDDNYKYTLAPSYSFNDHFLVRGELSYTDSKTDVFFSGVQALLKF